MKKVIIKKFEIEPFLIDFHVYFTEDPTPLVKKLIKENPHPSIANELTRDWIGGDELTGASVSAGKIGKKMDSYGIIAVFDRRLIKSNEYVYFCHEAMHVLSHIYIHTGVKFDPNNDEFSAYMIDYIVRMMIETLKA